MTDPRTKLVCTLGPASATPKMVRGLARAGATIFRLNASHGSADDHARSVSIVRDVEAETGRTLAILADLPGPKVRLGSLDPDPFRFQPGQAFRLRPEGDGDVGGATTTYPGLAGDLREGDRILLADGAVELVVVALEGSTVVSECVRGGIVRSHQGVNVPAERLGLPAVTDRDRAALAVMLELGVDLVAQSFVREAADVDELREAMAERAVPIVAKIETKPAVEQIDRILEVADGLMVARGDLGVELPMEEIPLLQKDLLRAARRAGRPSVVATQMLESMIHAPRPTRAEATDVANAVLDGADAIMLSGETAIGEYPFEAASAAIRIARAAEDRGTEYRAREPDCMHAGVGAAVAHAAAAIVDEDPEVVAVTCYTETGRTARLLAAERPGVPVFAFIPDAGVRRGTELLWGVRPLPADPPADTDEMISLMDRGLVEHALAGDGDHVVMAAASPAGKTTTNMVKVHVVGSPVR
jgi:pyruvate kinase